MISIIDYKAGNLTSVERALKRLGIACRITRDPKAIEDSDRVIFPGVGAAGEAMKNLRAHALDRTLKSFFLSGRPLLGICLGTQVIMDFSQENETACLGIMSGSVVKFPSLLQDEQGQSLKIPHMGWNTVEWARAHPLIQDIPSRSSYYFVHSYYPQPHDENMVLARTHYGVRFPSAVAHKNLVALQFHPEKSGPPGLALLRGFAEWEGKDVQ